MKHKTKIPRETFQTIMLESFRYCLGRRTYAVSECVENLIWYWRELSPHYQELIYREIQHAIDTNSAGDACDVFQWKRILRLKEKENYTKIEKLVNEAQSEAYNWEYDVENLLSTIQILWKEYNKLLEKNNDNV